MAYQNVSTPRFYISLNEWLNSLGLLTTTASVSGQDVSSISRLNPSNQIIISDATEKIDFTFTEITSLLSNDKGYFGILGHNFASQESIFSLADPEVSTGIAETEIINSNNEAGTSWRVADSDGFTILSCNYGNYSEVSSGIRFRVSGSPSIGCISFGNYYDMPIAPNLSLSLEHDYSGVKKFTSMGGASFSNANWIKPPKWGDKEAWQLGDFPRPYSGRRIWDLSFDYISDTDLEPRNYTGTKLDDNNNPAPSDDNWFDNVLYYTMGGHLPFIFQPNKDATYNWTDTTPAHITEIPELAICRLDMNSFSREQVARNVYNIKVKVKETW